MVRTLLSCFVLACAGVTQQKTDVPGGTSRPSWAKRYRPREAARHIVMARPAKTLRNWALTASYLSTSSSLILSTVPAGLRGNRPLPCSPCKNYPIRSRVSFFPTLSYGRPREKPPMFSCIATPASSLCRNRGMSGTLDSNQRPLIISMRDLGEFDDSFLASAVSRGDIVFTDPEQVKALVKQRDMGSEILSIDRIADLGLYDAQTKQRNAQLGAAAIALAVLALVMCVSVTAWIFALLRRRRWFVQRTAGKTWRSILVPRMLWEASAAILFGTVMALSFSAVAPSNIWISGFAPLAYLAVAWLIHQWAATTTFRTTLARRG